MKEKIEALYYFKEGIKVGYGLFVEKNLLGYLFLCELSIHDCFRELLMIIDCICIYINIDEEHCDVVEMS